MNISVRNVVCTRMKTCPLFIAAGLLFILFSPAAKAIDNPVGSPIAPPTTFRSGLIQSPNPIDTGGNRVITGNIRAGRYFRGIVPYQASSQFIAEPGSGGSGASSLDSFLRDSVGSGDLDSYTGRYRGTYGPYYSATGTVTTISPGRSTVSPPPTAYGHRPAARINDRIEDRFAPPQERTLPSQQYPPSYDKLAPPYFQPTPEAISGIMGSNAIAREMQLQRPLSTSPQQMDKTLLTEVEKYHQGRRLAAEQQQRQQMEQFQNQLRQVRDKADELEKKLTGRDDSQKPLTMDKPDKDLSRQFEIPSHKPTIQEDLASVSKPMEKWAPSRMPLDPTLQQQIDVYDQMKQQIDNLQKQLEQSSTPEQTEQTADQKKTSFVDGLFKEETDLSLKAKAILGEHKSFASFSEDKFNQYLRAAEEFLKKGKYYRAADAYTLASIYKPDDPLPYAGKSHALFAAGEYISSALFLSRALEIFPEYAKFKIDIVAMLGDKDKLETRITDVKEWIQITEAAELQFLLAYVYYQMNRIEWAKAAIDAAYEKMPASAVSTLKKAIDYALESY